MRRRPGTEVIGEFEVKSGKLVVSDPCYDRGTWCAGILNGVKNGKWIAEVQVKNEGQWGMRNAELHVYHDGHRNHYPYQPVPFEVGVDSGQACVCDEAVFPQSDNGEYGDLNTFYGRACAANDPEQGVVGGGIIEEGRGVNVSSGYGDGSYRAYTVQESGEIVGVRIVFISDDSYCEECGELTDDEDLDCDGICYDCRHNGALEERDLEEEENCPNCGEHRETACRCGWTEGEDLE